MDFNLKTYKHFKTKHYLNAINYFYFFHGISLTNKNWVKVEQILKTHKLNYYRILNKLMIKTLKYSIFKNLITLIHGPIILLNSENNNLIFREVNEINSWISLLSLRLNNRIYSKRQIRGLNNIFYFETISKLYNSIKTFTKMPYCILKNKKQ